MAERGCRSSVGTGPKKIVADSRTDNVHVLANISPGSPEVEARDPVEVSREELLEVFGRSDVDWTLVERKQGR